MNTHKWQSMLNLVNQHPELLQTDLTQQFNKLCFYRLITENLLVFLLQYMSLMLTTALSPLSLASGTAAGFIFMRGYTILPGLLAGNFFAYYLTHSTILFSSLQAFMDAAQAFLLLWISHRFSIPSLVFYNRQKWIGFVFICGLLTAITSYNSLHWLSNWLANLNGIFILASAIITWDVYFSELTILKNSKIRNKLEIVFYYGLLTTLVLLLLFSHKPFFILLFSLFTLPLIMLISLRLGWCGVVAAVFLFGFLLNLGTYLTTPLFTAHFAFLTSIYLQWLLLAETLTGLFIIL